MAPRMCATAGSLWAAPLGAWAARGGATSPSLKQGRASPAGGALGSLTGLWMAGSRVTQTLAPAGSRTLQTLALAAGTPGGALLGGAGAAGAGDLTAAAAAGVADLMAAGVAIVAEAGPATSAAGAGTEAASMYDLCRGLSCTQLWSPLQVRL